MEGDVDFFEIIKQVDPSTNTISASALMPNQEESKRKNNPINPHKKSNITDNSTINIVSTDDECG
jgi:hypothetical protein